MPAYRQNGLCHGVQQPIFQLIISIIPSVSACFLWISASPQENQHIDKHFAMKQPAFYAEVGNPTPTALRYNR